MVTPDRLAALPHWSNTGTALPGEILSGIFTFTSHNPATSPYAAPAYCTSAGWPPILTV
jgi:hypothetical protein